MAVLLVALAGTLDWSAWHTGLNNYDESAELALLQLAREGHPLILSALRSCLHRLLLFASARAFGFQLGSLHLVTLLSFLFENILLANFTRKKLGSRAASWALIANSVAAFTLVRQHSLLAYGVVPAEVLFFWLWLELLQRPAAGFIWAFAATLLLFDYEAWLLGVPLLGAFYFRAQRGWVMRRAALMGTLAGFGLLAALSWGDLHDYLALRLAVSGPMPGSTVIGSFFAGLHSYWVGDFQFSFLGASGHPVFPPWALPMLVAGAWAALSRWRSGLAWVALGFIPLLSRISSAEPQRAILAWPGLCVLAGLGAVALREKMHGVSGRLLLAGLLLFGCVDEAAAFWNSRQTYDLATYGQWRQWISAARACDAWPGFPKVLTELGPEGGAARRFLLKPSRLEGDNAHVLALISPDYLPAASRLKLRIHAVSVSAAIPPAYVAEADGAAARRLGAIDAEIKPLMAAAESLGSLKRRQAFLDWLDQNPRADPWARSVAWDSVIYTSIQLQDLPFERVQQALAEPLQSAYVYEAVAGVLMDASPRQSLVLAQKALQIEPGRDSALKLKAEAMHRLKLGADKVI